MDTAPGTLCVSIDNIGEGAGAEELDRSSSVVADLAAMYAAHARIREYAATRATVVPGHDPPVLDRFPALDGVDFAVWIQPPPRQAEG